MKFLFINMTFSSGSTGRIVQDIASVLRDKGHSCYIVYAQGDIKNDVVYPVTSKFCQNISIIQTRLFGHHGLNNNHATKKLIKWIDDVNPDVIHLHNIHGFYLNYEVLFKYLYDKDKKVIWTLHDCWSITGHCASFDYINCIKWINGCEKCPQLQLYPISFCDQSKYNYQKKKFLFTKMNKKNLYLTVPSEWLNKKIKKSYLGNYDIKTINNGINVNVFRIIKSNKYRKRYKLENKKIILSVMFGYNKRKGVDDLNKLAEIIDHTYKIILVGIEKKDSSKVNKNIIVIPKTDNQEELVKLYNEADVFVNLTLEEVFGMTNIEALACGTPVVTYNSGGCKECIDDNTGFLIEKHDVYDCFDKIKFICNNDSYFNADLCRERVLKLFTKEKMIEKYLSLYEEILK